MATKYAEVIFEPGSKSVMSYESDDELQGALKAHHNRAVSGADGGPAGNPAERVHKVITYDSHPADDNGGMVKSDAVSTLVSGMTKDDGTLDANQLISALREEMSPTYPQDQGAHNSMYKAEGTEYDLAFLNDGGSE